MTKTTLPLLVDPSGVGPLSLPLLAASFWDEESPDVPVSGVFPASP